VLPAQNPGEQTHSPSVLQSLFAEHPQYPQVPAVKLLHVEGAIQFAGVCQLGFTTLSAQNPVLQTHSPLLQSMLSEHSSNPHVRAVKLLHVKYVGDGVGALVLLQLESSLVSVVYPSLHSHVYP
jgi:hypothetical protein